MVHFAVKIPFPREWWRLLPVSLFDVVLCRPVGARSIMKRLKFRQLESLVRLIAHCAVQAHRRDLLEAGAVVRRNFTQRLPGRRPDGLGRAAFMRLSPEAQRRNHQLLRQGVLPFWKCHQAFAAMMHGCQFRIP